MVLRPSSFSSSSQVCLYVTRRLIQPGSVWFRNRSNTAQQQQQQETTMMANTVAMMWNASRRQCLQQVSIHQRCNSSKRIVQSIDNNNKRKRVFSSSSKKDNEPSALASFLTAGLPLVLFSLTAAWVVKNGLEGKTREREVSRGQVSM